MDENELRSYFEGLGFHVKDGIKYGVDFLLYTDNPEKVHSKYAILINRNQKFLDIIAAQRVCHSTRKKLIFVYHDSDNKIKLVSIGRFSNIKS